MIGKISNFRGGRQTRHTNQAVIEILDMTKTGEIPARESMVKFMGKRVEYKTKTKSIIGTITRLHGKKALVATFNKGLPGEAISADVIIED